ncbi:hypothetical protein SRHO_G00035650 [Serrasalmus rhombeus]
MSGKRKHARKQSGTKTTVEDTAGKPPQDPPPPEKLKCFQDVLDIVCGLSDEEWRALTSDAPHARSKAEFASLCTNIMISVGKSAVKSFLPTLIHTLGMEAVLTAEEQLRKRTHSESRSPSGQSTTPTKPAASSHDSDERPNMEPSEIICTMIEDFVSELRVAMQEASCKASSFPKSWAPKESPMVEEMTNVLSELFKKSEHEDAPSTGRKIDKAEQETQSDVTDIAEKITVVVLDLMDGGSVGKADFRTSDVLNAAAEKIKHFISNSEDSINKRILLEQSKRQNAEELQAKASKAVSQVILSSGVWELNGGSPKMPSSLASEADLDSMLEAMAQSGFPTEMIRSHLESTSREIVDIIVGNIDMLSCHRKDRSKSGFPPVITNIFQTINEKVRKFFHLSKQAVKESSTELLSDDDDHRLTKQVDVQSCTGEVIHTLVDSSKAKSERFLTKATQVVSDLLVKSDPCSSSTSIGSSNDVHDAAINIAATVVEALDQLVESSVIDSQSDCETIIRSLEASTHTLNRSGISEERIPSTSFNLFRRVHGYVQALFTSLAREDQTAASIQEAPVSDLQLSRDHSLSQLDDLTITCTNSIVGEIVQLCHSAESAECQVPAGDKESEAIYGIIQGLEELARGSSSSSKSASSGRDLGDRMDRSFSNLDSALKAGSLPHAASSIHSAQRLFSAEFRSKASQTVGDILLKTGGDFSNSVSTKSSEAFSTTDFQSCITDSPSAVASSLSVKAFSTAVDITEMFLKHLRRYCSSSPLQKNFLTASRSIYRGVHKKVFGFFLGHRESFSAQDKPTEGAQLQSVTSPRFKVHLDSCAREVIVKIVELYKSELLLPKLSSSTLPQISHSMSLLSTFPCDHGIHEEDKVYKICSSVSRTSQTSVKMKTIEPPVFVNEDDQIVSDIMLKRPASKIAWDEPSQSSLTFTRGTSTTHILSDGSTDLENADPLTAATVVDSLDKYVDQCSLETPRGTSFTRVIRSTDFESPLTEIRTNKDVTQPQFQQPSAINQGQHFQFDKPLCFHEVGLTKLRLKCLGNITGTSQTRSSTSDSVLETSWVRNLLRDPVQVPLAVVYPFVEESVKSLLLHVLSHDPELLISSDRDIQGTSFEGQSRNSDKSSGFQSVSSNAVSHFTKSLAHLAMKSLPSAVAVSDTKAPVFSFGFRKLNKVCPAGLLSADHPPNSSPENLQEPLQTESKDLMTPFKKARKRLSRIFSSVGKALPNPLSCMTQPS